MESRTPVDSAAAARRARFGALPERIRFEDMLEEQQVTAEGRAGAAYDPDGSWMTFSCLAAELGL